jgi:hypothetical protein
MNAQGFDPSRSRVSYDTMAAFIASPVTDDILSVPGIGPATAEKLSNDNIDTTYQLIGLFLTLKGKNMTQQVHCDAFWFYLQSIGVNAARSGIVHSIAEKTNIMMPGIFELSDT